MIETTTKLRPDLEALPGRLRSLPVDDRGYPVPWFVPWIGGKPEFRAADSGKRAAAVTQKKCWVCGDSLGRFMSFVLGPMCGINRTSAEPPSHLECATWSARNCPFLKNSGRKRREDETINAEVLRNESDGFALARNPGVVLVWTTRHYQIFRDGKGGWLIRVGEPEHVEWYAEGKPARREQIIASVDSGLPALMDMARDEGPQAVGALALMKSRLEELYPTT